MGPFDSHLKESNFKAKFSIFKRGQKVELLIPKPLLKSKTGEKFEITLLYKIYLNFNQINLI